MRGRDESGNEGGEAREILRAHFHGERALFSPESSTNRRDFQSEMTFPDPEGGADIFAHFHGKISHRFFRLHFDWPVPMYGDPAQSSLHRPEAHQILMAETLPLIGNAYLTTGRRHEALS